MNFCAIFAILFVLISLPSKNIIYLSINQGFVGFFIVSIIPIGQCYANKITYPISEVMSYGVMFLCTNISGIFFVVLCFYITK